MKSAIFAATVLALGVLAQEGPKINTPTALVTCQPSKISWTGGVPPYFVSALPGGQAGAAPLKDWGQQSGTELTWVVDLPAGTSISMQVKDSNGDVNYAQAVDVRAGSDTKCLEGASVSSGSDSVGPAAGSGSAAPAGSSAAADSASSPAAGAATKPASAGASSAAAPAGSSAAGGASGAAKPSGSASASASGGAAPASQSSAGRIVASTGLVGAAALFLAAFL
ncbi:hypothetical protein CcaverHIS002_0504400 [Cutaneotrichosporon cavernicola]|uniref:Uncharacterized protein n=1 Tax=Cutaneotrichosporon cavernicola TaxID=279322 RepID=A0AA48QWZ8_9TREE|nr:uncharacterized protein CcaverHIS019_0504940 [Cutaneotrichosporon cavernicola]BEI85039.1 hypothetical protein CcaverHIS002_0504400 [Cutaneotrichosporon cavernicola]BEI92866.1 hypothetical protein CcaverHIS019_0504940 [Cutaneotrichosporon cavernicola]BEJ00642.1 hypothetical protein CcaverHIS631_0504990 [Cutaneotrichosporon cavernicola]BEJ08407.1 hypothetical protein CcaverHIS641_0504920 [Cutaneotrichosporon cavernicola]